MRLRSTVAAVLLLTLLASATAAFAQPATPPTTTLGTPLVRFAQFNASVNRTNAGQLLSSLQNPASADAQQLKTVAEIIQRIDPDVLLINEFDYYANDEAANLFRSNFLEVSQNGQAPVVYPYVFVAPSNTGIASGFDLNNNGAAVTTPGAPGYGDDAFGFGAFEGQFGMAVFSKYPIERDAVRTFQTFRWKDMPGNLLTNDPTVDNPATAVNENLGGFYSAEEQAILRLSSKSHWDVPILIGGQTVHTLVSHPTPPVFDGPEDRNGKRNHDEIRLWNDYVTPGKGKYLYDDAGKRGGLAPGARFVIMGDQNADPNDGDSYNFAIRPLLANPLINTTVTPTSEGGPQQAELQGGANTGHTSDPTFDTADFADTTPGNLRADYVLPSAALRIVDARVFWPLNSDPAFPLVGTFPFPSSDHRAVYVDLDLLPTVTPLREMRSVFDLDPEDAPAGARLGDADDPAIWVHPDDPAQSMVVGVVKDGGLDVYDLGGRILQTIRREPGKESLRYNNVDLVYGVKLGRGGRAIDLMAVTDRRNDLMVFFRVDPKGRQLINVTAPGLPRVFTEGDDEALDEQTTTYGVALWKADDDEVYAFVSKRSTNEVAQLRLIERNGRVAWENVRTIRFPLVDDELEESQVEGMVVDQETGTLYAGQEQYGIWRTSALATGATLCPGEGCTLVDAVAPNGTNLKRDVEGLTIYYAGEGKGYLLASSQGDNTFAVYDRQSNAYLGSFRIGSRGNRIDSTEESDGADVVNVPVGRGFSRGLLVVQDGNNDPALLVDDDGEIENVNSNFKFVRWDDVAKSFATPLIVDTRSYDPRD